MAVGRTQAIALLGLQGAVVEIEADYSSQLPKFVLIGLPDAALGEARDRVLAAAANSGCDLPSRRLTVNLSPAALPKQGSGFDLGIALATLAAAGTVSAESIASVVHLGELGLDGRLRPITGILPAVSSAAAAGFASVMVPSGNAAEAALVPGIRIVPVASLRAAAIWHGADLEPIAVEPIGVAQPADTTQDALDLSDVIGNADAVEALIVAAAGGHHMFLLGPPGSGKTMLASRMPGILPDLNAADALEVSSIRSLCGLPVGRTLVTRPPWESPHHTATAAALIGGGSKHIRPGAAARASSGVLFLDEKYRGCHAHLSDGGTDMTPTTGHPGPNARPARARREVVYPVFARTGPDKPLPGTRPISLYLRLSKYHRDKADAIERQRLDLTRKLTQEGGWTIMGEYIDNDSASASAERTRKAWRQLNLDIKAGMVSAVAFWKLDRTNRVASRCIEWIADCQREGVYLVSHQDSADELNTATAGAKLVTGIKALLAEVETDTMSERQLASKRHLAEAGFYHGGMRPFGWQKGPRVTDEHGRSGFRLVPHPVEHLALKEAVSMVLVGKSLNQIARHWSDEFGITTATGAYPYEATIYRSLVSPRMIGYRMRQVPDHQRGVKIDLLDYIALDEHGDPVIGQEPVCDRSTWLTVRRLLDEAKTSTARRPWGSHEWLLTGLVYCQCGAQLYGHNKVRRSRDGERRSVYTYRCMANRLRGPGNCSGGCTLDAEKAESYVLGWFFAHITDEAMAAARSRRNAARASTEAAGIVKQLDEARAERVALLAKQGTDQYRGPMVAALLSMIEAVQARIDHLERLVDIVEFDHMPAETAKNLPALWQSLDIKEKRAILRRLVKRVDALPGRAPTEARLAITGAT